jgi:hypothetical protein
MRARALARDWGHHTRLLQHALDSILAQTNPAFDVVVVCHDIPEIPQAKHGAVHMLTVDFPPPEKNNDDMCIDKVLKISRGVEWAIARGSDYVMFVDADDLVSRRLSEFVAAHPGDNGWYFYTGYVHRYGDRCMRKHTPHHLICGTGVIVRTNLLRFGKSDFCRGQRANTLAAAGIENYLAHLAEQGTPIQSLPFPGAVYVLHTDSTSEIPGGSGYRFGDPRTRRPLWRRVAGWGKRTAKRIPNMRPVTAALRTEFSVPKADVAAHG